MMRSLGTKIAVGAVVVILGSATVAWAATKAKTPVWPVGAHHDPHRVAVTAPATVPPPPPPDVPPPTLPVPQQPYTSNEPHPISTSTFTSSIVRSSVTPGPNQGQFVVNSAWQITPNLSVASGSFQTSGEPGIITLTSSGVTSFTPLAPDGATGPAYIKGVKGDWVLIAQGYGYAVFNFQTHQTARSDQNADVLQ